MADIMYDEFLQVKKDFGMLYMQEVKDGDDKFKGKSDLGQSVSYFKPLIKDN